MIKMLLKRMLGLLPSCKKVNSFLMDYVDGSLDRKTASQFEQHLEMCPKCVEYLKQYRLTIELAGSLPAEDVPNELHESTSQFLERHLSPS